jgi:hypothetical protein
MPLFEGFGEAFMEMAPAIVAFGVGLYYLKGPLGFVGRSIGKIGGLLGGLSKSIIALTGPWGVLAAAAAAAGVLVYKNWDVVGPVFEDLGKILAKKVGPAFKNLWKIIKVGVKDIWNRHLKPFADWFEHNLPELIRIGVEGILKSFAVLKLMGTVLTTSLFGGFLSFGSLVKLIARLFDEYIVRGFKDMVYEVTRVVMHTAAGWYLIRGKQKEADRMFGIIRSAEETRARERSKEVAYEESATLKAFIEMEKVGRKTTENLFGTIENQRAELQEAWVQSAVIARQMAQKVSRLQIEGPRVKESPKKEPRRKVRPATGGGMTFTTAEVDAAERAEAAREARAARGEGGRDPLAGFLRSDQTSYSRAGVNQIKEAVRDGVMEANKKTPKKMGTAVQGGVAQEGY